jgi:ribosomal protein L11 methyltransferase
MIRLAVRCAPEYADHVLANLLELAPNGVEEERGPGWIEFAIYGRIGVRPSWWDAKDGLLDVVVDPGRAFGTGGHPTTRLCLALMLVMEEAGEASGPLADWGTGSGVLAIAASKLGWGPITGCDREPASLEAAVANAEANGVELALERIDVREDAPPVAPTVVANLTAGLLEAAAGRLVESAAAGNPSPGPRAVVCSGMLAEELDRVAEAFAPLGLGEAERRLEGDWAALLLRAD